ncbi:MAG: TM2 domain-containing protein [Alcaligenaceae bacterium]|nr:TM2 domain-containing protein [Alcaligenaceae bacterium]
MKGAILGFDAATNSGTISGDDGNRYSFNKEQWKSPGQPVAGMRIDFVASSQGIATDMYLDATASASTDNSKKITAALLALFLGCFGIHKFYLGYKTQGLIMLLVFIFGFILLGLPSLVIGIIAFVEFILYIMKSDQEFTQTYVIGHRPWF